MAQLEKLKKLKHSVLKKMNSFGKHGSGRVSATSSPTSVSALSSSDQYRGDVDAGGRMVRVWVGKSRREYHVRSQVVDHPAFQKLIVGLSDGTGDCGITIGCEVVLFEHLLWMLENDADNSSSTSASASGTGDFPLLDDLVAFYT